MKTRRVYKNEHAPPWGARMTLFVSNVYGVVNDAGTVTDTFCEVSKDVTL